MSYRHRNASIVWTEGAQSAAVSVLTMHDSEGAARLALGETQRKRQTAGALIEKVWQWHQPPEYRYALETFHNAPVVVDRYFGAIDTYPSDSDD